MSEFGASVFLTDRARPAGWSERVGLWLAFVLSALVIYSIGFALFDETDARFGVIALASGIVLFSRPLAAQFSSPTLKLAAWGGDALLLGAFVFSGYWFLAVKEDLWTGFYTATPTNLFAGALGLFVLLELTRRAWGWSLVVLALVFVAFGFAGPFLPGGLEHFGMDANNFMQIAWYSFDGVFGRITGLVANTVLVFLIFGAMLERTGAGESLIHISTVVTARIRGGAAHAAIVASGIFGMMSGSVAANIAGTGVFTIPMIKRQGFSANFAGAVETAASSGGQLTPPIMAAAVFIMADLVGKPYVLVIAAAALPAFFKYLSLFAQVYAEAVRLDMKPLPKNEIPKLTRRDWYNSLLVFFPIAVLMIIFLQGKSPAWAGLSGVVSTILAGLVLNPTFRRKPKEILRGLAAGGITSAEIMVAVATIGVVLGVVNETGVAIRFGIILSSFGEDQLFLALLLAMLGALVLGMGLPTLPAYLIMAIMIAPAIIKAGVPPLAAHMFVLYYAVYSSIVPPIAYGCYVAAPICGGHPIPMSFIALRLSIVGLLVPYIFVYSPSLLLVAGPFSWPELMGTIIRLLAAIWMFASSLAGADPLLGRIKTLPRTIRFLAGAAALFPFPAVWLPGVGLTVLIVLMSWQGPGKQGILKLALNFGQQGKKP